MIVVGLGDRGWIIYGVHLPMNDYSTIFCRLCMYSATTGTHQNRRFGGFLLSVSYFLCFAFLWREKGIWWALGGTEPDETDD